MKQQYLSIALFVCIFSTLSLASDPAVESIEAEDMEARIRFLADDAMAGRDTPGVGLKISANYVISLLREWGVQPITPAFESVATYRLPVLLQDNTLSDQTSLRVGRAAISGTDGFQVQFVVGNVPAGEYTTAAVFAGYGRRFANEDYDSWEGVEVKDKLVFVIEDVHQDSLVARMMDGESSREDLRSINEVARYCYEQGALALVLVSEDVEQPRRSHRRKLSLATSDGEDVGFLITRVPITYFREVIAENQLDYMSLIGSLKSTNMPVSRELPQQATLSMQKENEHVQAENIIGIIPGSDPELRKEYVIVGAHLDHVGANDRGDIWNGADDNASGVAALLEIAQAMMLLENGPRRSVVFALWTAEEHGLLGSHYFVNNLPMPKESIVAYLNMDMVGRDLTRQSVERAASRFGVRGAFDEVSEEALENGLIVYMSAQPFLKEAITSSNAASSEFDLLQVPTSRNTSGSDHQPFEEAGIPVMGFFTGFHDDYHQPTDTVDKVNFAKSARVARLVFETALTLANR